MLKEVSCAMVAIVVLSCAPWQKNLVADVVDVSLARCIAEAASSDEREVQALCQVADVAVPILRRLLAAKKLGAQKTGAMNCPGATTSGK